MIKNWATSEIYKLTACRISGPHRQQLTLTIMSSDKSNSGNVGYYLQF